MSKGSSAAKYKLTYFDVRARCEHIRLLFAAGKLAFDDVRIKQEDWPTLKPTTPLGALPMLEVNGQKYSESLALGRYVAKEAKMYGSSNLEQLDIDMIVDVVNGWREDSFAAAFEKDEKLKAEKIEKLKESVETKLDILAKRLGKKKYFVGDKLSWADIHFYTCVEILKKPMEMNDVLDKQPALKALFDLVAKNEGIAKYLKTRKDTQF